MGWRELRRRAASRGGSRCAAPRCGEYYQLRLIHRRPVTGGGESNLDNLVFMCPTHAWWYRNRRRLVRDPRFWGRFVRAILVTVGKRLSP